MSDIEDKVKKIIEEKLSVNADQITNDARFAEDLKADSLDTVELVMALEDEFGLDIPDEEAEKIKTVQNAIDYINVEGRLDGRASCARRGPRVRGERQHLWHPTNSRRRVVVTGRRAW